MVSSLEAHLGYWLRFLSNQVSQAFSHKLAQQDVSVGEWVVLRELYDRPETVPSALAERLGMTRGAISKLADRLGAKGLARRTTNASDRRFQSLALTPAGRALVPRLAALADANDEAFFGDLTAGEKARLERTLRALVRRHELKTVPID